MGQRVDERGREKTDAEVEERGSGGECQGE